VTSCFRDLSSRSTRLPELRLFFIKSNHLRLSAIETHVEKHGTMAKQATIYIVDLGSTMGDCHNGRTETDLDFGMRYIWDKIATTMAANLKGGNLGVIGLRTDGTENPLDSDDSYDNISVSASMQGIGRLLKN